MVAIMKSSTCRAGLTTPTARGVAPRGRLTTVASSGGQQHAAEGSTSSAAPAAAPVGPASPLAARPGARTSRMAVFDRAALAAGSGSSAPLSPAAFDRPAGGARRAAPPSAAVADGPASPWSPPLTVPERPGGRGGSLRLAAIDNGVGGGSGGAGAGGSGGDGGGAGGGGGGGEDGAGSSGSGGGNGGGRRVVSLLGTWAAVCFVGYTAYHAAFAPTARASTAAPLAGREAAPRAVIVDGVSS